MEPDPFIEAEVERALEPYKNVLPADALDEMREVLRDAMLTHPAMSRLVRQLQPREDKLKSGDEPVMKDPRNADAEGESGTGTGGKP